MANCKIPKHFVIRHAQALRRRPVLFLVTARARGGLRAGVRFVAAVARRVPAVHRGVFARMTRPAPDLLRLGLVRQALVAIRAGAVSRVCGDLRHAVRVARPAQ